MRASGSKNFTATAASRGGGAGGSAGDPGSGGAGEDADANGELGARDGEIVRIPDAEVFGGKICAVEEPGAGGGKGESGADDGCAGRGAKENRGVRPAGGETGQGEISGDEGAATSVGSGRDHHSELCADDRGQGALRQESGCGPLLGVEAAAESIVGERPGAADHQGRRLFLTKSAGGVRAEDTEREGAGHSAEAVWKADRGAWEKEGQEAGRGGGGAKAGGIAAQALGDRGSLRTV